MKDKVILKEIPNIPKSETYTMRERRLNEKKFIAAVLIENGDFRPSWLKNIPEGFGVKILPNLYYGLDDPDLQNDLDTMEL